MILTHTKPLHSCKSLSLERQHKPRPGLFLFVLSGLQTLHSIAEQDDFYFALKRDKSEPLQLPLWISQEQNKGNCANKILDSNNPFKWQELSHREKAKGSHPRAPTSKCPALKCSPCLFIHLPQKITFPEFFPEKSYCSIKPPKQTILTCVIIYLWPSKRYLGKITVSTPVIRATTIIPDWYCNY